MENSSDENITREIIGRSRLEIENPDFDRVIMNKIVQQVVRKNLIRKILLYTLMVLLIEAILFFIIRSVQVNITGITSLLGTLPQNILFYFHNITLWIFSNGYLILPVIVILIIKMIIDLRLKFS